MTDVLPTFQYQQKAVLNISGCDDNSVNPRDEAIVNAYKIKGDDAIVNVDRDKFGGFTARINIDTMDYTHMESNGLTKRLLEYAYQ